MNENSEFFIRGSIRTCEGFDNILALVNPPDEQWVHQTIDCPKWQIKEIDDLVKSGKLDLSVAEERRFRVEISAWSLFGKRVEILWNTKDKLAEVFARYRKQHPDVEENMRRKEALREFEDIRFEIMTRHQFAL